MRTLLPRPLPRVGGAEHPPGNKVDWETETPLFGAPVCPLAAAGRPTAGLLAGGCCLLDVARAAASPITHSGAGQDECDEVGTSAAAAASSISFHFLNGLL